MLVLVAPASLATVVLASCSASGDDGSVTGASGTAAPTVVTEPPPGVDAASDAPLPNAGGVVDPVIAAADWYSDTDAVEVSGYVSGVVEGGGTCSVVLTLGENRVQTDGPANADASTTTCGTISVPADELVAGTWGVQLLYSSPSSSGTSDATIVEVPA